MLKKLRKELNAIRGKKNKEFDDFRPLILRIARTYASLFPNFTENTTGSHYVYNFGIEGYFPFTIVKEHGGRDCQSPKTAKRAIASIEDILDFIESRIPDDQDAISEGGGRDAGDNGGDEESSGTLSDPKVPDGDC
jgi:hypothetical protein